jgi:phage tail-like protein
VPTTDPVLQANVQLEIDGVGVVANFTSVSGVASEVEIVDNPYVNEQGKIYIAKLPGKPKTQTITLKRGLTVANELWEWHNNVMNGQPDKRNGSAVFMNTAGEPMLRYDFTNAMVSKISLSEGGATTSGVQIEEATLACETLVKGGA